MERVPLDTVLEVQPRTITLPCLVHQLQREDHSPALFPVDFSNQIANPTPLFKTARSIPTAIPASIVQSAHSGTARDATSGNPRAAYRPADSIANLLRRRTEAEAAVKADSEEAEGLPRSHPLDEYSVAELEE